MSIKGLLIEKLQETFGRYVSGISPENLTVELLNGVIRQENLELRREALVRGAPLPLLTRIVLTLPKWFVELRECEMYT